MFAVSGHHRNPIPAPTTEFHEKAIMRIFQNLIYFKIIGL